MKTLLSLILILSCVSAGVLPTNIIDTTNLYFNKLENQNIIPHRSGLTKYVLPYQSSVLFSLDAFEDNQTDNKKELFEFEAFFEKLDSTFISLFDSFVKTTGLCNSYFDTSNATLFFIPKSDSIFDISSHYNKNATNNVEKLEEIAKNVVEKQLLEFQGRIEFHRTDITRENGVDITGVDVWFRRIFKNAILPINLSSVVIGLNGDGEITSLRVKWPKLIKIENTNSVVSYNYCKQVALDVISNKSTYRKGNSTARLKSVAISGVARAWHLIKTEIKYIITPCISFENEYTNDQNEKIIRFLDVPTFEKYYKVK